MKKLLPLIIIAVCVGLTGYSSGPASSSEQGFTGAPSAGGGKEGTCGNCHRSGSYGTPQLQARFDGMEDLTYRPGQTYTVTISVRPEMGEPAGYGFQAQFLDGSDPIPQPVGLLSEPDDATQIATTGSGRTYAEHKGPNSDSLFSFNWTAPSAGMGSVSLYLTGNIVNRADGSQGDNGSKAPLVVTLTEGEEISTSTTHLRSAFLTETPYPNPATDKVTVPLNPSLGGRFRFDLIGPDGKLLESRTDDLPAGQQSVTVDLLSRASGLYHYRISGPSASETVRLYRN